MSIFKRRKEKQPGVQCDDPQSEREPNGLNDIYIFDFKSNRWRGGNTPQIGGRHVYAATGQMDDGDTEESFKSKIKVKPIDILDELKMQPRVFALDNIDDKISVLKDKEELINNTYAKTQVSGLISCLENRKKYDPYFSQFQTTTLEKIESLLKTHELVMKEADIFIPEFPDEAIKIMKAYSAKIKKVTGKKPVFYVIATDENFEKVYNERDPILLAQSPFGMYYDILGAWDKEMLLLSEL